MTSSNVLLWKHVSITSEVIFIFRVDRPDRVYDVEHRAGVDPLLVVAGSEPIEFVASFTVWTSPDKSLKRDDDVSDDVTTSIYSSIVCRRHGNHRSLVTSSAA